MKKIKVKVTEEIVPIYIYVSSDREEEDTFKYEKTRNYFIDDCEVTQKEFEERLREAARKDYKEESE